MMMNLITQLITYLLVIILNHYFPQTKFAVNKHFDHVAIYDGEVVDGKLTNGKLYDSFTPYTDEELEKLNIENSSNKLDPNDFKIYTKDEIDNFEIKFGRNLKIEGNDVVNGLILELKNIPTIKVGKELLK